MRIPMIVSIALLVSLGGVQAGDDFVYFKTPSGNISCAWYDVDGPEIRCDIRNFTSSLKRPADCDLDWGYAFAVGAKSGKGAALCAGDTVTSPEAEVLEYGNTFSQGGLSCVSEAKGLTCRNNKGHGFSLSRAKQRVF